jgi:hypothetical protein
VIDSEPRPWTEQQVSMVRDLAAILSSYIELRTLVGTNGSRP